MIGVNSRPSSFPISLIYFRVGRNPYEVCLHSSLKLPGGDTLLDVHPTLLKVLCNGCIPPSWIYLEGDEGRAKRCISARSDGGVRTEVRRGGVPPSSRAEDNATWFLIDLLVYRTQKKSRFWRCFLSVQRILFKEEF